MVLTIDIPEKVIARAAALGLPVGTLVANAINQIGEEPVPPGFVRLGTPTMTPAEATAAIREIASTHTLGGLSIKELINEGRRI